MRAVEAARPAECLNVGLCLQPDGHVCQYLFVLRGGGSQQWILSRLSGTLEGVVLGRYVKKAQRVTRKCAAVWW